MSPEPKASRIPLFVGETYEAFLKETEGSSATPLEEEMNNYGWFSLGPQGAVLGLFEFIQFVATKELSHDAKDFLETRKEAQPLEDARITFFHEIGHAFDFMFGLGQRKSQLSNSPLFQQALRLDFADQGGKKSLVQWMQRQGVSNTAYLLSGDEIFADCTAEILSGKATQDSYELLGGYPRCMRYVKKMLDGFQKAKETGPEALWDYFHALVLPGQTRSSARKAHAQFYASLMTFDHIETTQENLKKTCALLDSRSSDRTLRRFSAFCLEKSEGMPEETFFPLLGSYALSLLEQRRKSKAPKAASAPSRAPTP